MRNVKIIFAIWLISLNAIATKPTCEEVIQSCEDALQYSEYVIDALKKEKQIQLDLLNIKDERIKQLDVWYRDPMFMIPAGIIIGIGIGAKAGK